MENTGSLELILGPMYSGKSTELLKRIDNLKITNKSYLVVKSGFDDRYDINYLVTHDNKKEKCITVNDLNELDDNLINSYNTILIDEGQFLKNLKNKVIYWVEKLNKNIIIAGLDGDYKREPIGEMLDLIPYADDYKKMKALCLDCKLDRFAIFSHRLFKKDENPKPNQILVATHDCYTSLCRVHYLKKCSI
jgi:thymidine kinase